MGCIFGLRIKFPSCIHLIVKEYLNVNTVVFWFPGRLLQLRIAHN
jgi:hypothetical protein